VLNSTGMIKTEPILQIWIQTPNL